MELVLVMLVICTILGMAAPSLTGWNRTSQLKDVASDFISTTRWARSQAAADSLIYRLCFDPQTHSYRLLVQNGQEFVNSPAAMAQPIVLPDGFAIEIVRDASAPAAEYIEFYPTGRIQPGRVRVLSDRGNVIEIVCATPTENYHVISTDENSR